MADLAGVPPVEQVLTHGFEVGQHVPIDVLGFGGEAALRRRHPKRMTHEQSAVVSCDSVDRMSFGHLRVSLSMGGEATTVASS